MQIRRVEAISAVPLVVQNRKTDISTYHLYLAAVLKIQPGNLALAINPLVITQRWKVTIILSHVFLD